MRWRKCMKPPNCTLCELRWEIESFLKTKYRDFKPFVLSQNVEVFLGFLKSSDFLCDKLYKGKIGVWGHEAKYDHPEDPLPLRGISDDLQSRFLYQKATGNSTELTCRENI